MAKQRVKKYPSLKCEHSMYCVVIRINRGQFANKYWKRGDAIQFGDVPFDNSGLPPIKMTRNPNEISWFTNKEECRDLSRELNKRHKDITFGVFRFTFNGIFQ